MMSWRFKDFNKLLIIFVLIVSAKNVEASSFFGFGDYYRICEKKAGEWTAASEYEEEDDAMLIKAKIAFREKRYEKAIEYADEAINKNSAEAKSMQNSLEEYPWESKERIFRYKALNTVGLALYIKVKSYLALDKTQEAKDAYKELREDYYYAQCWCNEGLFLKPSELAQEKLDKIRR